MEPNINSAIKKGLFKQVRFLIELGQSVNFRDSERRTPLMLCALIEDEKWGVGISRILIEKGAVMAYRDKRGLNALHYSCIYGRKELTETFLKSPDLDINQGDCQGNTPLHYVAAKGDEEILHILIDAIQRYVLKVDKPNRKGVTALMQAWQNGREQSAKILVNDGSADPMLKDFVEQKNARDYEEEFRIRQEEERLQKAKRRPLTAVNLPRYMRPVSAASTLSKSSLFSKASQSQRVLRSRPQSAAARLMSRQRVHDQEEQDPLKQAEKEKQAGSLIRSVSYSNLRNKPEYILDISPVQWFLKESRFRAPHHPSTVPQGHHDDERTPTSWKSDIKSMYTTFDFQFTSSYCHPAKIPEDQCWDDHDREGSPQPSEFEFEKLAKKVKGAKTASKMFLDPKSNRKGSARSQVSRKLSSNSAASSSVLESSSSESINMVRSTQGKKRALSAASSPDIRDENMDTSSQLKDRKERPRSRKISASMSMDVPVVVEPQV